MSVRIKHFKRDEKQQTINQSARSYTSIHTSLHVIDANLCWIDCYLIANICVEKDFINSVPLHKLLDITPLKLGAENRPRYQCQKVMYFPNFMLKYSHINSYFDLKWLSQDQFSKATQNLRVFKEREHFLKDHWKSKRKYY